MPIRAMCRRINRVQADWSGRFIFAMALGLALATGQSVSGFAAGDAEHGAVIYRNCMACHSLDKNGIGPRHRGVFGRKAGSLPDYQYSAALKASNIVWNETTLDQWLTNPQVLVSGSNIVLPRYRQRQKIAPT